MLITETEAKTKWCPFARVLGTLRAPPAFATGGPDVTVASGPQNRGYAMGGGLDNCRCLASGCMAWRPGETEEFKLNAEKAYRLYGERQASDTGFCGLAGKVLP